MLEKNSSDKYLKTVQFTKIRDVKSPVRACHNDAGTDFFIPNYTEEFFEILIEKNVHNDIWFNIINVTEPDGTEHEELEITVPGGEQVMIPSGIKVWILDKSTYLQATNKSGIASKYSLTVGANTIDADYQGEVHINLLNTSNKTIKLYSGQKVVQFIHKHYIDTNWEEITNSEYDNIKESDRGAGGFGHTGEK